jgi:glutathione S-transferase
MKIIASLSETNVEEGQLIGKRSMVLHREPAIRLPSRLMQETLNVSECQGNFTRPKKLYLSDYSNFILRSATLDIITNKAGGELETSYLKDIMWSSDGILSNCAYESYNPNFPSWKNILPKSVVRNFTEFSCQYYDSSQDGSLEQFCTKNRDEQLISSFPSDGYIFMRSSYVNRTRRREIASDLCRSIEFKWDSIVANMVQALLQKGWLTKVNSSTSLDMITIPIEFYVRTPSTYSIGQTSATVKTALNNSFNSLLYQTYSRRLRLLQSTALDYPVVSSVELTSMSKIDCYEQASNCYDIDSRTTIDLNNRGAKKLHKILLHKALPLEATDNIFFYNDLQSLQSSAISSQSQNAIVRSIIFWSLLGSILLLGSSLLFGAIYLLCRKRRTRVDFSKMQGEGARTPPASPDREHGEEDNKLIECSLVSFKQPFIQEEKADIELSKEHSTDNHPLLSFPIDDQKTNFTNITSNPLHTIDDCRTDSSSSSNSSLISASESITNSVSSALKLVHSDLPRTLSPKVDTDDHTEHPFVAGLISYLRSGAKCLSTTETSMATNTANTKSNNDESDLKKKTKSKWAVALDESSGEKYYYNRITKQPTWDRPASFDGDDREGSIPVFPKFNHDLAPTAVETSKQPHNTKNKDDVPPSTFQVSPLTETKPCRLKQSSSCLSSVSPEHSLQSSMSSSSVSPEKSIKPTSLNAHFKHEGYEMIWDGTSYTLVCNDQNGSFSLSLEGNCESVQPLMKAEGNSISDNTKDICPSTPQLLPVSPIQQVESRITPQSSSTPLLHSQEPTTLNISSESPLKVSPSVRASKGRKVKNWWLNARKKHEELDAIMNQLRDMGAASEKEPSKVESSRDPCSSTTQVLSITPSPQTKNKSLVPSTSYFSPETLQLPSPASAASMNNQRKVKPFLCNPRNKNEDFDVILWGVQPSANSSVIRAFLAFSGLTFKEKEARGSMETPEYSEKFPSNSSPAIECQGECIYECVAILRFLCRKYPRKYGKFYPESDIETVTTVDWLCDYITMGVLSQLPKAVYPTLGFVTNPGDVATTAGTQPYTKQAQEAASTYILEILKSKFVRVFLKNTRYLMSNTPTIADFRFAPMINIIKVGCVVPKRIQQYYDDMTRLPGFEEACQPVVKFASYHWKKEKVKTFYMCARSKHEEFEVIQNRPSSFDDDSAYVDMKSMVSEPSTDSLFYSD